MSKRRGARRLTVGLALCAGLLGGNVASAAQHNLDDVVYAGRPAASTTTLTTAAGYFSTVTSAGQHNLDDVESC
ncbi:MAG TPA: hypothetical protein VFN97_27810 [Actinospica sp.]|nr:hypothetical protein [Actinospica sp.]